MFDVFFGIACETKILEVCGWDEERASFLMERLSLILEDSNKFKAMSPEKTIEKIKSDLHDSASESEIEILVDIIRESIQNMPFLLMKEEEYEN